MRFRYGRFDGGEDRPVAGPGYGDGGILGAAEELRFGGKLEGSNRAVVMGETAERLVARILGDSSSGEGGQVGCRGRWRDGGETVDIDALI